MKKNVFFILGLILFTACEVGPKPINYGSDSCDYCSMTIVDRQHSAEIVTEKAKVRKFDAIECMINYDREHSETPVALYLAADFNSPGKLIDATKATYLISEQLSSPMGANLSAFSSPEAALEKQQEYGGRTLDWESLNKIETLSTMEGKNNVDPYQF